MTSVSAYSVLDGIEAPMHLTISPYDLTHRAPGAVGALLVGEGAATIVRIGGAWQDGDPEDGAEESPALSRVLDAWRWTMPLWSAGILGPTDAAGRSGIALVADALDAMELSRDHPILARLAARARTSDRSRLAENLCIDILRGGRDPSVSVPIASALERFSAETGWPLVICPTGSVVGGIELRMARPFAGMDCPTPIGAPGDAIVHLRQRLAPELDAARGVLTEGFRLARSGASNADATDFERSAMIPAADSLRRACASIAGTVRAHSGAREWAMVRYTIAKLPPNAMARAAEIAAGHMVGAGVSSDRPAEIHTPPALDRPGAPVIMVRHLPWDLETNSSGR